MSRVWHCPECDTLNQDEKCVVCGYEKPQYDEKCNKNEEILNNKKCPKNIREKIYLTMACISTITAIIFIVLFVNKKDTGIEYYYYDGHKYMVCNYGISWKSANKYCKKMGGHLVSIGSANEQRFVQKIIRHQSKLNYWIELYKNTSSRQWEWTDGTKLSFTRWDCDSKGGWKKPDNYYGDEYYVRMYSASCEFENWQCNYGFWDDTSDNADGSDGDAPLSTFGFICEWDE